MADFDTAIKKLLDREGGDTLVVDDDDAGGVTKFGISQRAFPKVNIRALTEPLAAQLYRAEYWTKIHGDDIASQPLAEAIFDCAVNQGAGRAIRWIQEIVNVGQDGIMGPMTVAAINALDANQVLASFRNRRISEYRALAARVPSQLKYLKGWVARAEVA